MPAMEKQRAPEDQQGRDLRPLKGSSQRHRKPLPQPDSEEKAPPPESSSLRCSRPGHGDGHWLREESAPY